MWENIESQKLVANVLLRCCVLILIAFESTGSTVRQGSDVVLLASLLLYVSTLQMLPALLAPHFEDWAGQS
jgi:hypothetical protein